MLDPALDELTRKRAKASAVDWRNAWAGIDASGTLRAWPATAAQALGSEALDPGPWLVTTSVLEPMRREPRHASEMISEVIAGAPLRGLFQRDGWWLVSSEDHYVGWVHQWVLTEATGADDTAADFRYGRPHGTLWLSDHQAATPLWFGMKLRPVEGPLQERGGFHLLRTPTGAEGWLPDSDLMDPGYLPDQRALLNLLRGLSGVPYRWGGRSPLGFDCSGLVQFVVGLCGVTLPRDAIQQSSHGDGVDLDATTWQAGDLVFFGQPADHVGFYDGRGGLLHCQGQVRHDKLEGHPLQARVSGVRRWWGLREPSA